MSKRSLFAQENVYSRSIPQQPGPRQAHPGATYDFGVAYPDPDSLPLAELAEGLRVGLEEEGRELAKYPHPSGYPPLREYIAARLARDRSLSVSSEDVILGDGSSQPNHMVIEALMNPGEVVLTEQFTYPGTLGILRRFGADIRGVACDRDGFLPDALEQAIRSAAGEGKRVKLIYRGLYAKVPKGRSAIHVQKDQDDDRNPERPECDGLAFPADHDGFHRLFCRRLRGFSIQRGLMGRRTLWAIWSREPSTTIFFRSSALVGW